MARSKYLMIRIDSLYAISGIYKKKKTYRNQVSENISDRFLKDVGVLSHFVCMQIYLKADGFPKKTYSELVTGRKFFIRNCHDLESRIEAVDGSCCTKRAVYINNNYGVEDYKEIITFFQELKVTNMYEKYINKVAEIFRYIDLCKEKALNGEGKVEDSIGIDEYAGGISHDAKRILNVKKESKGKM